MTRFQADLLLLACAILWGTAFYYQKEAMQHMGPLLFLAARSVVAALALAPLAAAEWRRDGRWSAAGFDLGGFLAIVAAGGALFFIGGALQQIGIVSATVINSGFLTGLYVVITPFVVWAWTGVAPGRVVWLAATLAFAGAWALGGGSIGGFSTGDALIAACAAFWAVHLVVTGAQSRFARPMTFTALQFVVVAVLAGAAALATEPVTLTALADGWIAIAYVGILSSAVTFGLLAIAMRHTPAPETAILISLETVFAALTGMLLLGERLAPIGWLGAAAMVAASMLVPLAPIVERRLAGTPARSSHDR